MGWRMSSSPRAAKAPDNMTTPAINADRQALPMIVSPNWRGGLFVSLFGDRFGPIINPKHRACRQGLRAS